MGKIKKRQNVIDRLPPDVKEKVDDMIKSNCKYYEIEEMEHYKNTYCIEAILMLLNNKILERINNFSDEQIQELDTTELVKSVVALTRAISYRKKSDIQTKTVLKNGAEFLKSTIYQAMAEEAPELYRDVKKFIDNHLLLL